MASLRPFKSVINFVRDTLADTFRLFSSKEGIKSFYGVSLYRNAVYLMLGSVATALFGFIFWLIAARVYPAEAVGLGAAAISAMALLGFLATLGLGYGIIRFLPDSGTNSRVLIGSAFTTSGLLSLILTLIFLAGLNIWSPALLFLRAHPVYFISFIVFTAGTTLAHILDSTFVAKRRAEFSFALHLSASIFRLGLVIILSFFFTSFGIFASQGLGLTVSFLLILVLFIPRVESGYKFLPILQWHELKRVMHFSFTNYIAQFLWMVPGLVLPIIIVNTLGGEQNAYFYIAWAIAGVLGTIGTSVSTSLFAEGSYSEKELHSHMRRSLKLMLLLLIPAIIIVVVLTDRLLLLFGSGYSESATHLLWLLSIASLPLSINWLYFGKKMVERNMKPVILVTGLIAVFTIGMSYIFLPKLGILSTGISWLFSQTFVAGAVVTRLLKA